MRIPVVATILLLVTSVASAQMGRHPGMGQPGGSFEMAMTGDGMELPVASDGTVFVVRKGTSNTTELVAIRPAGTVAWSYPVDSLAMRSIALTNTAVVVSSFGVSGNFPNYSTKSQLIGISITTGAKLWSMDLDGIAMGLTPYNDGVYAVTTSIAGFGSLSRKLISVAASDGKVRFSMPLD